MRMRKVIFLLLVISAALLTCTRSPERPSRLFRLIDHLNQENILQSPVSQITLTPQTQDQVFPIKSYPLTDSGSGDNPYGLKRKLQMEAEERNIIFSPPGSKFQFFPKLTKDSKLEFGIGIIRQRESQPDSAVAIEEDQGINFLITLESQGRKRTIFQKYLSLLSGQEAPEFSFFLQNIELPYEMEDAILTLSTKGEGYHFSFWINPVVYRAASDTRRVILISIDTLRADHLGCYGYDRETSPHIDALAADSAKFNNTYASSPWTLPSHVSLLTSLHGVHHQVYYDDEKMPVELITLADQFREAGFSCGAITGGGFVSSVYGFSKGFDTYNEGEGGVFRQDSAEMVFRAASEWIEKHEDRDFFLFIHTYQPHSPYACPLPYNVMFLNEQSKVGHIDLIGHLGGKNSIFKPLPEDERRNIVALYDGEIRYTDDKLIDPLISQLKERGLYDGSMIIFTSDHGEEFFEHGGWGHGHSVYDESLKVPLLIKFPGSKFKGENWDNIVSLVDIMPTVMDEMEIDYAGLEIDGKSLFPVLQRKEREDRTFLADVGGNLMNSHIPQKIATNQEQEKLIVSRRFTPEDLDFFAFPPPQSGPVELYDLLRDPAEKRNRVNERSEFVSRMVKTLNDFYSQAKKIKVGKARVDERLRDQLKALGYLK